MRYPRLKLKRDIRNIQDARNIYRTIKFYEHNASIMNQVLALLYRLNKQVYDQDARSLEINCGVALNGLMKLKGLPNSSAAVNALHKIQKMLSGPALGFRRDTYDSNKYDRVSGELEPSNVPNWSAIGRQVKVATQIVQQLDIALRKTKL